MAESEPESLTDSPSQLRRIFDLLVLAGFADAERPDITAADKLAGGLAWCVDAANAVKPLSDVISSESLPRRNKSDLANRIEDALRTMGCPHALYAFQIENADIEAVFPVVQWLVNRVRMVQRTVKDEGTCIECLGGEDEQSLPYLEKELRDAETTVKSLDAELNEQKQRKINLLNESWHLQKMISQDANPVLQKLIPCLKLLKALERKECHFQSMCNEKCSRLQAEIIELEEKMARGCSDENLSNSVNHSLNEALEELSLAKRELGSRLKAILSVRRQLDDIPCQSELIQYERRFSELEIHIQGKLRQTRKNYATYNALLEIKDLMLKETSLLNSISSQFQDAITSSVGRAKLIDSMEGIVKGSQQKLERLQLGLQEEQKVCDAVKQRYAATIAQQRQCYSLLKVFQEQCAKNEKLKCQRAS